MEDSYVSGTCQSWPLAYASCRACGRAQHKSSRLRARLKTKAPVYCHTGPPRVRVNTGE